SDEELTTGFLAGRSEKTGRLYDYYRGRVIYPIVDTTRNIVAFGGRIIGDGKPKYLNTSDTPAFKKSKTLFALNFAKDYLDDGLILCEGYMDVISLHQAGFQNAVATLGTAITEEHARIIAKYTNKVYLSYDSDGAGQNATSKAIRLLENVGVEVKIIRMTGAKDPDEFIKAKGAAAFRALLKSSVGNFDFRFEKLLGNYDIDTPEGKLRAASEAAALVAQYSSSVERDIYSTRVCERLSIREQPFAEDVKKNIGKAEYRNKLDINSDAFAKARYLGDRVNPEAAGNIRAAAAEDAVLGMLLLFEEFRDAVAKKDVALEADDFITSFARRTFEAVMKLHKSDGGFEFSLLSEQFGTEEIGRMEGLCIKRKDITNTMAHLTSSVLVLKEERLKKERTEHPDSAPQLSLTDLINSKKKAIDATKQNQK
ncbi:MAG: toprim domain-containing protein, partial [Clostridia bacterium]|nr:toprim domain-containing protein [Clostridia bacterium]